MPGTAQKNGFLSRLFSRVRESAPMGAMLEAVENETQRHGHALVTDAHLLLHLLSDVDVRNALTTSGAEVLKLAREVQHFLETTGPVYRARKPMRTRPTQQVLMILEQAELRTMHSRGIPFSVQVLIGLLAQPGPASSFLVDEGITALHIMEQLSHAHLGENLGLKPPDVTAAPEERVADVVMLNDEFTSMEFVLHVLEGLLQLKPDEAERVMMRIHNEGHASCGTFFLVEAQQKMEVINGYARRHGMPLKCVLAEPQ